MNAHRSYRYQVVDVFTKTPLEGNPLAVFLEAPDLDTDTMQAITRELNLSETVFVVPSGRPDCVARLRIFTPRKEVDFAGHPTVGTGFVLARQRPALRDCQQFCVEENVGAIPVLMDRADESMIWLRTPPIENGATIELAEAAALVRTPITDLLDATPQILSAGNPTLFIALRDRAAVDKAALDGGAWQRFRERHHPEPMCTFIFAPTTAGAYSRMFAPDYGIAEDPATGSSTGPLALYMMRNKLAPSVAGTRFVSEQGTQMKRRSILHVNIHGEKGCEGIEVGGCVTPVIEGQIWI